MSLISKQPSIPMEDFRRDLLALLNTYAGSLDASELLALCAYTTGQLVAMQDARKWDADTISKLLSANIEAGNADAIQDASKWMPRA